MWLTHSNLSDSTDHLPPKFLFCEIQGRLGDDATKKAFKEIINNILAGATNYHNPSQLKMDTAYVLESQGEVANFLKSGSSILPGCVMRKAIIFDKTVWVPGRCILVFCNIFFSLDAASEPVFSLDFIARWWELTDQTGV